MKKTSLRKVQNSKALPRPDIWFQMGGRSRKTSTKTSSWQQNRPFRLCLGRGGTCFPDMNPQGPFTEAKVLWDGVHMWRPRLKFLSFVCHAAYLSFQEIALRERERPFWALPSAFKIWVWYVESTPPQLLSVQNKSQTSARRTSHLWQISKSRSCKNPATKITTKLRQRSLGVLLCLLGGSILFSCENICGLFRLAFYFFFYNYDILSWLSAVFSHRKRIFCRVALLIETHARRN